MQPEAYSIHDKGATQPERWAVIEQSRKPRHVAAFVKRAEAEAYARHINKLKRDNRI